MTMMEHLKELRRRLVISLLAFLVVSIVAFFFYEPLLEFIRRPLCDLPKDLLGSRGCGLVYMKVLGGFLFRVKLTALAGIVFSSPFWLYQLWAFITPGLTSREKKYAIPFVVSSIVLFAVGAFFAYITLPTGIRILVGLGGSGLDPLLGADEYLNFVGLMFLGFGATFELPLVLLFLGLAGVISVETLRKQRKAAIVAITAIAAIVTPSQDPYTLLVLAVPLYALYELTIVVLRIIGRRRDRTEQSV
jgi:sec-independent protein translocase protein TatC